MKRLFKNKILLFYIILIASLMTVSICVVWPRIKSQKASTPAQETGCIKNKDQAVKILLGTDSGVETPMAVYKKEVEARGNQVFFEQYSSDVSDSGYQINYIDVGEELKNGSKLLHARYSYSVDACDIDLNTGDVIPAEDEKKFQFSFTNNDEAKDRFVDETVACYSADPTTRLADLNSDGQAEIIVDCNAGAVSSATFSLYVYELKDNKLNQTGHLDSEGKYDVKDCNGDNIQDVVTYIRDVPRGSGSNAEMGREIFCNHWNKQKNKFVETKIGEE